MVAWLLWVLLAGLAVLRNPAEATHAAYGTISWERNPVRFDAQNCVAHGSGCHYVFYTNVALRESYYPGGASVSPATSHYAGALRGYTSDSGKLYINEDLYVAPDEVYTADDWFIASSVNAYELQRGSTTLVWHLCCRLSTLKDRNNDQYSFVATQVATDVVRSHVTTGLAREYAFVGRPIRYDVPIAPSGTTQNPEFRFEFAPTGLPDYRGSGLLTAAPSGMVIDPLTGKLRWTPAEVGLYAMQVRISEGYELNGRFFKTHWISLDFIMEVIEPCDLVEDPECNMPPYFVPDEPPVVNFYRGIEGSFEITAKDDNPDDLVTVTNTVLPKGATFNEVRVGNPSVYRLRWTPDLDDNPAVVCFQARDSRDPPAFSVGNYCVQLRIGNAALIYVSGIIRDFRKSHADFDLDCPQGCDAGAMFVETRLGPDDKPTFVPGKASRVTRFGDWFNDVPGVNERWVHSLTLSNGSVPDGRIFTYLSSVFWPIDNMLFGNEGDEHNNFFTYEIHTYVVYEGGEIYEFRSSDDLAVFINHQLDPAWSLLGVHELASHTLDMDRLVNDPPTRWGLVLGEIYPCDIFWAHRGRRSEPGVQLQLPNAVLCDALSSGVTTIDFYPSFGRGREDLTLIGRPRVIARPTGAPANPVGVPGSNGDVLQLIHWSEYNDGGAAWFAELQSTPDGGQEWLASRQKVLQGFGTAFDFVMMDAGRGSGTGDAEGFAFVFQADGPRTRGMDGNGLGYHLLPKSLAIEFDSKTDPGLDDPTYDHVSLHTAYGDPNDAHERASLGVSAPVPEMQLTNGTVHRIRIEYSPAKDDTQAARKLGWVRLWMNDNLAPVMQCQVDDTLLRQAMGGAAYVGFTVSSGPETGGSASILLYNWNTVIVPASAAQSSVVQNPLPMLAGGLEEVTWAQDRTLRQGQLVVQLRDACANLIPVGNEPFLFQVTLQRRVGSGVTVDAQVVANGDGSYLITFNPTEQGVYDIEILYDGLPIRGSPFDLDVRAAPSDPRRSAVVFGRLPVVPHNAPANEGLFVVTVDMATGLLVDDDPSSSTGSTSGTPGVRIYDFSGPSDRYGTGGPAGFLRQLQTLPKASVGTQSSTPTIISGRVVALACVRDCAPLLTSQLAAFVASELGCRGLDQLKPGGSYACVGHNAHTIRSSLPPQQQQQLPQSRWSLQNERASDSVALEFIGGENGGLGLFGNGFTVSAASGGAEHGMVRTGTQGGFGRIQVVPGRVVIPANREREFAVVLEDRFGNQQTQNADNLDMFMNPDILAQGGDLQFPPTWAAPGYLQSRLRHTVAGNYFLYARLSNALHPAPTDIAQTPLAVQIIAGPADAERSLASGDGLSSARSLVQACFGLTLYDEWGNLVTGPNPEAPDHVLVSLHGPVNDSSGSSTSSTQGVSETLCNHQLEGPSCGQDTVRQSWLPPAVPGSSIHSYQVCFTARYVGEYEPRIMVNGAPLRAIQGQTILVTPGPVHAPNSRAYGPGIDDPSTPLVSGQEHHFFVQSVDRAGNLLTTPSQHVWQAVFTPSSVKGVRVLYDGQGVYRVVYTPLEAITHQVSLEHPAPACGSPGASEECLSDPSDSLVGHPRQPMPLVIGFGRAAEPSELVDVEATEILAGQTTGYHVIARDSAGNLIPDGQQAGAFVHRIGSDPNGEGYWTADWIQASNPGMSDPTRYPVLWNASVAGMYYVRVVLASNGQSIAGVPEATETQPAGVPVLVRPDGVSCSGSEVTGPGQFGGDAGAEATFLVYPRDSFGNAHPLDQASELGLEVEIDGQRLPVLPPGSPAPAPGTGGIGSVRLLDASDPQTGAGGSTKGSSVFEVRYRVPECGGQPFLLRATLSQGPACARCGPQGGVPCPLIQRRVPCTLGGRFNYARPGCGWDTRVRAGVAQVFCVEDWMDLAATVPRNDSGAFRVEVVHEASGTQVAGVTVQPGLGASHVYPGSFTATRVGSHRMNITSQTSGLPASGNPFVFEVAPGPLAHLASVVYGLGPDATGANAKPVGVPDRFWVETRDRFFNRLEPTDPSGSDAYVIQATGLEPGLTLTGVWDPSQKMYRFDYNLERAGPRTVVITESGRPIQQSGHALEMVAGEPDATRSWIQFAGTSTNPSTTAGELGFAELHSRDRYGNPAARNDDFWLQGLSLSVERPSDGVQRPVAQFELAWRGSSMGVYAVTYNTTLASSFDLVGTLAPNRFSVTLAGVHLGSSAEVLASGKLPSPFELIVRPGAVSSHTSRVLGLPVFTSGGSGNQDGFTAGLPVEFEADLRDTWDNPWTRAGAGQRQLRVRFRRCGAADTDCDSGSSSSSGMTLRIQGATSSSASVSASTSTSTTSSASTPSTSTISAVPATPRVATSPRTTASAAAATATSSNAGDSLIRDANALHTGDGRYQVSIEGQMLRTAGAYELSLQAAGTEIRPPPGPDALRFRVVAGPTHAPSTEIPRDGLNSTLASLASALTIRLADRWGNPILRTDQDTVQLGFLEGRLACGGGGNPDEDSVAPVQADYFQARAPGFRPGTGFYDLEFLSFRTGVFTLNITVNGETLPCALLSRLSFQVLPGPGYPPRSQFQGPREAVAGQDLVFWAHIRDQYGNLLMRGGTDPLGNPDVSLGTPITDTLFPLPANLSASSLEWLGSQTPGVQEFGVEDRGNSSYRIRVRPVRAGDYLLVPGYLGGFISGGSGGPETDSGQTGNTGDGPVDTLRVHPGPPYAVGEPQLPSGAGGLTAGRPVRVGFRLTDEWGNPVRSPQSQLNVVFALERVGVDYRLDLSSQLRPISQSQSSGSSDDGLFVADLLLEWAGNYSVLASVRGAGGPTTLARLEALLQTCGGGSMPYRCPSDPVTGAPGVCVAAYKDCPATAVCPKERPVMCFSSSGKTDNTASCVADASQCGGCPSNAQRCADGSCPVSGTGSQSCPQPPPCPVGTQPCRNTRGQTTGECRVNPGTDCPSPVVCTPGQGLCPDGVSCASTPSECPTISPPSTPGDTCSDPDFPWRCPSGGGCVAAATDCPTRVTCPLPGQVVCAADGSCRASPEHCPFQYAGQECSTTSSSPTTTQVRCPVDGSCRSSLAECPAAPVCPLGWLRCWGSTECAPTLTLCSHPENEHVSDDNQDDGDDDSHASGCPLNLIRCWDGSCRENTLHCPSAPSCPPVVPVMCWDRSCVSSRAECPSVPNPGLNTACAAWPGCRNGTADSGAGDLCLACGDGSCVRKRTRQEIVDGVARQETCPAGVTCPRTRPVLCPDQSCVASVAECGSSGTNTTTPGADGSGLPTCPAELPVRCPAGGCATHAQDCPTGVSCPLGSPVRCPDGSCRSSLAACPTDPAQLACPPDHIRCPGSGAGCARALALCPSRVTCALGTVRCADGSCRALCPAQPFGCANPDHVLCPSPAAGVLCAPDLASCPQLPVPCPSHLPVLCLDRSCAPTASACPELPMDGWPERVPCPDGSWVRDPSSCPTTVSCPATGWPYLCWDETCRQAPEDCPVPITGTCPRNRPVLCPSTGRCADAPWNSACEPSWIRCPPETPVRCAQTGKCVADTAACPATPLETCPADKVRCSRDGTCRASPDDCPETRCPLSLPFLCADGLCAESIAGCTQISGCPAHAPNRCWDGSCVRHTSTECPMRPPSGQDACSQQGLELCDRSGMCVRPGTAAEACPDLNGCSYGEIPCLDGTCAGEPMNGQDNECLAADSPVNACPVQRPFRCADGYCAPSSVVCPLSPPPGAQPCSDPDFPVRCATGRCVASPLQCPTVGACDDPELQRCPDGSCRRRGSCPITQTCPLLSGDSGSSGLRMVRCPDSGLCAASLQDCVDPATGCPPGLVRCDHGACVDPTSMTTSISSPSGSLSPSDPIKAACEALQRPINGCPAATPHRCPVDGSCVQDPDSECRNAAGCLPQAPHRCPEDGSCAARASDCPSTGCKGVRCPDGSCAATLDACAAANGCPITQPVRCVDGSCARFNANSGMPGELSCPVGILCEPGQVLCENGRCVPAGLGLCPPASPCPAAVPHRCADGTCVASNADCGRLQCPAAAPVRCSDGACVRDPGLCGIRSKAFQSSAPATASAATTSSSSSVASASVTVSSTTSGSCANTPDTPVRCFDGSCARTSIVCLDRAMEVRNASRLESACGLDTHGKPLRVPCPAWRESVDHPEDGSCDPVICADGSCVGDRFLCPAVPACPPLSFRCPDGSCAASLGGPGDTMEKRCSPESLKLAETQPCPAGSQRCEDGVCRAVCLPFDGCPLALPFHCANRECAVRNDPELCARERTAAPRYQLRANLIGHRGMGVLDGFQDNQDAERIQGAEYVTQENRGDELDGDQDEFEDDSFDNEGDDAVTSPGATTTTTTTSVSAVATTTTTPIGRRSSTRGISRKLLQARSSSSSSSSLASSDSDSASDDVSPVVSASQAAAAADAATTTKTSVAYPVSSVFSVFTATHMYERAATATTSQGLVEEPGCNSEEIHAQNLVFATGRRPDDAVWRGPQLSCDAHRWRWPGELWSPAGGPCDSVSSSSVIGGGGRCMAQTPAQLVSYTLDPLSESVITVAADPTTRAPRARLVIPAASFRWGSAVTQPTSTPTSAPTPAPTTPNPTTPSPTTPSPTTPLPTTPSPTTPSPTTPSPTTPSPTTPVPTTPVPTPTNTAAGSIVISSVTSPSSSSPVSSSVSVTTTSLTSSSPTVPIQIRPVAESRLRFVANRVPYVRRQHSWPRFMGFSESLLSPAFECVTAPGVRQPFSLNLTYSAQFDVTRYPDRRDICLARVVPVTAGAYTGYVWRCVREDMVGRREEALAGVMTADSSSLAASFDRCGPEGTIYGFIHSPARLLISLPPEHEGWFAANFLWLVLGMIGVVAVAFAIWLVLARMRRYRRKYHDERVEVDLVQEEVDTMMQFGGKAGAKDTEVALTDNPMVTQLRDLQRRLEDRELEDQERELAEQEIEALERASHIGMLKEDRNSLQEELDRLRTQLDEGRPEDLQMGLSIQVGSLMHSPTNVQPRRVTMSPAKRHRRSASGKPNSPRRRNGGGKLGLGGGGGASRSPRARSKSRARDGDARSDAARRGQVELELQRQPQRQQRQPQLQQQQQEYDFDHDDEHDYQDQDDQQQQQPQPQRQRKQKQQKKQQAQAQSPRAKRGGRR